MKKFVENNSACGTIHYQLSTINYVGCCSTLLPVVSSGRLLNNYNYFSFICFIILSVPYSHKNIMKKLFFAGK
ncbi:MAG: hypothetical protein LBE12_11770 [Planctomycetaceae bacterium]|nr:hypothetical protein [Planctomycetaceae bacterium]